MRQVYPGRNRQDAEAVRQRLADAGMEAVVRDGITVPQLPAFPGVWVKPQDEPAARRLLKADRKRR
jgi:hypothetical protein